MHQSIEAFVDLGVISLLLEYVRLQKYVLLYLLPAAKPSIDVRSSQERTANVFSRCQNVSTTTTANVSLS